MNSRDDIEALKAAAEGQLGAILGRLGINGAPRGASGYFVVCDPMSADHNPSLAVWTRLPGGLSWKRYGADAQGDIISLVAYLNGWYWLPGRGAREAIAWLKDTLGFARLTAAQRATAAARARTRQVREDAVRADQIERDRGRAFRLWLSARPLADSAGETYLASRGIDLARLARPPRILRFLPDHDHTDAAGRRTAWPCLIAGCVDPQGVIAAVHRTWLAPGGRGKAPVEPARKVWPAFAGLVIPLARGGSGLSPRDAAANGLVEPLGLTEGIEDALAWSLACPERRIWAAISLANFANVRLPKCCESVIIARQNDWHSLAAVAAFDRAKAALARQGRPVVEIAAVAGKDLNDTIRA